MNRIKLCRGKGNGVDTACLATAVSMIVGKGEQQDYPDCLCPVMAEFIRVTNDIMSDEDREKYYGDLPWAIVGTRSTAEVEFQRASMVVDAAVRVFAPMTLWAFGMDDEARILKSLDVGSNKLADTLLVISARAREAGASAAAITVREAVAATNALTIGTVYDAVSQATEVAIFASCILYDHGYDYGWAAKCRELILAMAALSQSEVEIVLRPDQLAECLS